MKRSMPQVWRSRLFDQNGIQWWNRLIDADSIKEKSLSKNHSVYMLIQTEKISRGRCSAAQDTYASNKVNYKR